MAGAETFARLTPKRLAVRLPNWVGDVIMTTPALRALRNHFSSAEMILVGKPSMRGLLGGADWCQGYESELPRGADAAVIVPHSFRSAWKAWRAGIAARAGFRGEFRGWMLTHAVDPIRASRRSRPFSKLTYLRTLLGGLGISFENRRLELPLDAEAESRIEDILRDAGVDPARPYLVLNPGAAWGPSKRWPLEHFAQTGDALAKRLGAQVVVIAGPGEEEDARSVASKMARRAAVVGPGVGDFATIKSLIKRARAMVSNDSGPRHMAACFDVPCVTLVGPFHPTISDNEHPRTAMLWEGVDCSPCHLRVCPIDHRCLRRITPDKAVAAAARLCE
jgi:heptosyltransferase-2